MYKKNVLVLYTVIKNTVRIAELVLIDFPETIELPKIININIIYIED